MECGIQDNIMNPQLLCEQHLTYILEERNRRKEGRKEGRREENSSGRQLVHLTL